MGTPGRVGIIVTVAAVAAAWVGQAPATASAPAVAAGPTPAIAAGAIRSAANPSVCLDNTQGKDPGGQQAVAIRLESCGGSGIATWNQIWTVEADHTIRISGQCLTKAAASRLRLQPCTGASAQLWTVSTGHVHLRNSGTCLAPPTGKVAAGVAAAMKPCDQNAAGQRWLVAGPSASARALSAAAQLLDWYNASGKFGGLFNTPADPGAATCSNTYRRGNCWWWSALALYALADFADQNPAATIADDSIKDALASTYSVICGTTCPSGQNAAWPSAESSANFANRYYDDTGWWALTWVNAYRLTGSPRYLYLAEELWSYLTTHGWDSACGGALVQYSGQGRHGPSTENTIANVLYLRLSAWLYVITKTRGMPGAARYVNGVKGAGGANAVGKWLAGSASHGGTATTPPAKIIGGPFRSKLAPSVPGRPAGTPGSRLILDDHLTASCTPMGQQMWLHSQGIGVAALTDLYEADKLFGDTADARYYLRVADNLADTVLTDTRLPGQSPPGDLGIYYAAGHTPFAPPTVAAGGILSEPCEPPAGSESRWPADCVLRVKTGPGQIGDTPFLPNKGLFIRGAYCLARTLPGAGISDQVLTSFINANAASLWTYAQDAETSAPASQDLNEFGFLWGNVTFTSNKKVLNFATETSALELLNTETGTSTAMC